MSDIQRLTLISDPTNEFPKNANNIFKVRLPERLTLPGEGWHASLMSLTVPDQGQSNAVIATDPHTKVVTFSVTYLTRKFSNGAYRRVSFKTKECHVKLEEIMSAKQPVTSGNLFWQRVMQEMRNKSMQQLMDEQKYACTHERDERPHVSFTHPYQTVNFTVGEFLKRTACLDEILATLAGKLNSNESFNPDRRFQVDVVFVSMPAPGSGHRKQSNPGRRCLDRENKKKRCIITIKNRDASALPQRSRPGRVSPMGQFKAWASCAVTSSPRITSASRGG